LSRAAAVIGAAVAIAAASLLLPWALAFDPQAWVVWGRDAAHFALDTRGGPSWKPLPVVVTTPLSLTGSATPALWLVVARAGGLLAIAGAWVLGARLGGWVAGAVAAALMLLSTWWAFNTALGNSEGLLAAAVLWAVVAHLDGRHRAALGLLTAAALLRPEVWPFLGLYGLWLWRADRTQRRALVLAVVVVVALWVAPDLLGTGGLASASRAARGEPSIGSAALESVPALAVVADFVDLLTIPAALAALVAIVLGPATWRRGPRGPAAARRDDLRTVRVLAGAALVWVAIVAVMAQAGYAGNPRYLVAACAVGCVVAGVGAARVPVLGLVVVLVAGALTIGDLRDQRHDVQARADRRAALGELVSAAGGRGALTRCPVHTAPDMRPLVAWELDISMYGIDRPPRRPDVVVRARPYAGGPADPRLDTSGYRLLARVPGWEAWDGCAG
jgi:hypothetical protein